jgi:hypothetical protein
MAGGRRAKSPTQPDPAPSSSIGCAMTRRRGPMPRRGRRNGRTSARFVGAPSDAWPDNYSGSGSTRLPLDNHRSVTSTSPPALCARRWPSACGAHQVELRYDAALAVIQDGLTESESIVCNSVACLARGGQGRIATWVAIQCTADARKSVQLRVACGPIK